MDDYVNQGTIKKSSRDKSESDLLDSIVKIRPRMYELSEEVRKIKKSAEYNDILFEVVNSKADPDVLKRYKAWEESSGYVRVNNRSRSKMKKRMKSLWT